MYENTFLCFSVTYLKLRDSTDINDGVLMSAVVLHGKEGLHYNMTPED